MFISLRYRDKVYTKHKDITEIIRREKMYWLLDSEVLNAEIEIIHNTLIWHNGDYLNGKWHYGVFKNGTFHGVFENGIFENGDFHGEFISGVNKNIQY